MKQTYRPSPSDIIWTQNLIRAMRDGGIWACPAAACVYKFDQKNKILTRTARMEPGKDAPAELIEEALETHDRIRINFERLGWTVQDI